jgi:hypothetical protein
MLRDQVIGTLQAHESELRSAGIKHLALFGSVARGGEGPESDIDLLAEIRPESAKKGFAYFGQLENLKAALRQILGRPVDLLAAPVRNERLRAQIEREKVPAF